MNESTIIDGTRARFFSFIITHTHTHSTILYNKTRWKKKSHRRERESHHQLETISSDDHVDPLEKLEPFNGFIFSLIQINRITKKINWPFFIIDSFDFLFFFLFSWNPNTRKKWWTNEDLVFFHPLNNNGANKKKKKKPKRFTTTMAMTIIRASEWKKTKKERNHHHHYKWQNKQNYFFCF